MSMEDFVKTLTDEQRLATSVAWRYYCARDRERSEVPDASRWQHEEPVSEAVDIRLYYG